MKLDIRIETEFSPAFLRDAAGLYRLAEWVDKNDDCAFLGAALKNSCAVAAAYDEGHLIGMGRALGDGVSDAYIQDVVVAVEYRKRGIGGALVRALLDELRRRGVDWIGLVGAPGTENFYRSLGFTAPAKFTFWQAPAAPEK